MAGNIVDLGFSAEETSEALIVPMAKQMTQDYFIRTVTNQVGVAKVSTLGVLRKGSKSGKSQPNPAITGVLKGTATIDIQNVDIVPQEQIMVLPFQAESFIGSNWESQLPRGVFRNDLSRAEKILMYLMMDRAPKGFYMDILRLFWFGDVTSSSSDYNTFTGFWKKAIAEVTAGTITPYKLTPNAALGSGSAVDMFNGILNKAPRDLKDLYSGDGFQSQLCIYTTADVYNNYVNSLSTVQSDESMYTFQNGQRVRVWNGIPIIVIPGGSEDGLDSGVFTAASSNVNWAVLTSVNDNLVVHFDAQELGTIFNSWFDPRLDEFGVRIKARVAGTYITSKLLSIAYPTT
jgi:hypothetical protein